MQMHTNTCTTFLCQLSPLTRADGFYEGWIGGFCDGPLDVAALQPESNEEHGGLKGFALG